MSGVKIELRGLSKRYEKAGHIVEVLRDVNLTIDAGEMVAIVGPSGIGKSTLLHMLGNLDSPTEGEILIDDKSMNTYSRLSRDRLRNQKIGFVFQAHNLLSEHSATDNVSVPVRLSGASQPVARARAEALLRAVGLGERLTHKPGELSGGEQQRVALARALVMGPGLVLADEPTGNLDPHTEAKVFDLMLLLNRQLGSTLIVVTHSLELASKLPRKLVMEEGSFREVTL